MILRQILADKLVEAREELQEALKAEQAADRRCRLALKAVLELEKTLEEEKACYDYSHTFVHQTI